MRSIEKEINAWLNQKFEGRENGVILDTHDLYSFEQIQDFIEAHDRPVKTPVIYYQAFADENLAEFIDTLEEELRGKLGYNSSKSCLTMGELIAKTELRTVAIDQSYLYTWETINGLWKWLKEHQVGLILVCSQANIEDSQILNHPVISQWDRFIVSADFSCASASCCSSLIA